MFILYFMAKNVSNDIWKLGKLNHVAIAVNNLGKFWKKINKSILCTIGHMCDTK